MSNTEETFSLLENNTIVRDSDKEVMATLDPATGAIDYTHPSRKTNYGDKIESLVLGAAKPKREKPEVVLVEVSKDGPPPSHPQLGAYSNAHLLYDHLNFKDDVFLAKWGDPINLIL